MSERLSIGTGIVLGLVLLAFSLAGMAGLDAKLAAADHVRALPHTLQVKDCPSASPARDLDRHL